ncbi:hypothetical protein BC829DRAFT_418560 [Chytridium lagenaria]|nr:hypothetical protein BC829DRAFT_418560 [Chytridium lagenaria]
MTSAAARIKELQRRTLPLRYDNSSPRATYRFLATLRRHMIPFIAASTSGHPDAQRPFSDWDDAWNSVKSPSWFIGNAVSMSAALLDHQTWTAFNQAMKLTCRYYDEVSWLEDIKNVPWTPTIAEDADKVFMALEQENSLLPSHLQLSAKDLKERFLLGCSDTRWRTNAKTGLYTATTSSGTSMVSWDHDDVSAYTIITEQFKHHAAGASSSSSLGLSPADVQRHITAEVQKAIQQMSRRKPDINTHLFDYVVDVCLENDQELAIPHPDDRDVCFTSFESYAFELYAPSNNVLLVMSFSRPSVATLMITDAVIIVLKVLHFAMIVVLPSIPPTLLDQRPFLAALVSLDFLALVLLLVLNARNPYLLGLLPLMIVLLPSLTTDVLAACVVAFTLLSNVPAYRGWNFPKLFDKGHLQLPSPKPLP